MEKQTEIIKINPALRLRPARYPEDCLLAVPWYKDPEVLWFSEGIKEKVYDLQVITRMYKYLSENGDLFIIETIAKDTNTWLPIGDTAIIEEDLPIVIGIPEYRGQGIGKQVLITLLQQAESSKKPVIRARVFDFNQRSLHLFEGLGFRHTHSVMDHNGNQLYYLELPFKEM